MQRLILFIIGGWLCAASVQAATLYAISGDDFGIPRRINRIDTVAATATPIVDLGDGNLGFFGLTFANDRFYTVANDVNGNSTLHSFVVADGGATSTEFSLGVGFFGGLVAQTGNQFYALSNTAFGAVSELHSLDLAATTATLVDSTLGFGAAGGLTWNVDDGLLYALGSDPLFTQSLYSIDPALVGSSMAATNPLGSGVIGGVDYAGAVDGFFAIGNPFPGSELLSVTLGGGAAGLFGLSPFPAYSFAGLTSAPSFDPPDPMPTPAPGPLMLLGMGLIALARRRR